MRQKICSKDFRAYAAAHPYSFAFFNGGLRLKGVLAQASQNGAMPLLPRRSFILRYPYALRQDAYSVRIFAEGAKPLAGRFN